MLEEPGFLKQPAGLPENDMNRDLGDLWQWRLLRHEGPLALMTFDKATLAKDAQRVLGRGHTDPEVIGKLCVGGQFVSRRQFTSADLLGDRFDDA
jgi:hypothetical protein